MVVKFSVVKSDPKPTAYFYEITVWLDSVEHLVHSVRGQSGFYNLALTERNMQIRFDLKLSAYSLGVDFYSLNFILVS